MDPDQLETSHAQIHDRLWIGGAHAPIPAATALVVTLHQPARSIEASTDEVVACFADSRFQPAPMTTLQHAAAAVRTVWPDHTVLVRCQHGLNRSALIAALALREHGVSPAAAIDQIRTTRPGALNNPYFTELIHTWPHDPMDPPRSAVGHPTAPKRG